MRNIKVLATDSTNLFLKEMYRANPALENCCVVTQNQTAGKGQMGATWQSESGKNLTFSILLGNLNLLPAHQFKISALVSTAMIYVLKQLGISNLNIKWPNDILAEKQKIAGILIENILTNGKISTAIIGIGLNVNQTEFQNLPQASSLKKITQTSFALEDVLQQLVTEIEKRIYEQKDFPLEKILGGYYPFLFKLNKVATFQFPNAQLKAGIIKKVTPAGRVCIEFENETTQNFEVKEIKLLY